MDSYSKVIENAGEVYAYRIDKNVPLTRMFERNFFVVRFFFSNIETFNDVKTEEILNRLLEGLKSDMDSDKGYYNIRIPTHIVPLLRAFNKQIQGSVFCGGTVEEIITGKKALVSGNPDVEVFFADEKYIYDNKMVLMEMAFDSFSNYKGQYHISEVTSQKAGEIYENWIKSYFDNFESNTVLVAQYKNEPVGFCTVGETGLVVEAQLGAVSDKYRGLGAYTAIIVYLVNYAYEKKKNFIISTQFDNFIVQGTWAKLGLKPFYSFYNFHYDSLMNNRL